MNVRESVCECMTVVCDLCVNVCESECVIMCV